MIGFINVNKPKNMSSSAVVGKIKYTFKLSKVGHMGTLDPLASGVLPIAVGKATRLFDYCLQKEKSYLVEAEFGYETDSLDLGTDIIAKSDIIPSFEEIKKMCNNFVGTISQLPPKYSAKKINGEKAYNLARSGEDVLLLPVDVQIYDFKCVNKISESVFQFEIKCSSGTYVRSLIRDLAYQLNAYATVTSLERTSSGNFYLKNSVDLDVLLNSNIENYLIDIKDVFESFECVVLNKDEFAKVKNGVKITKKMEDHENIIVTYENQIVGIASVVNCSLKLKTFLLED